MEGTAKYLITGLVDQFDEQHNITGQYPIGSIQELPVSVGIVAVDEGRAEAVGEEEGADDSAEEVEVAEEVADDSTEEVETEDVDFVGEGETADVLDDDGDSEESEEVI